MKILASLCLAASVATPALCAQLPDSTDEKIINMKEVKVIASYGNEDGTEPVALSSVSSGQIVRKLGNREFPQILQSVPSVYASRQGGGFGDSRLTLRGFGSENIAVLVNGIPINGMENGSIYWSNWAGLSDVTRAIQVQRGIGLSSLGLFSAGGTVNIITQTSDLDAGGVVSYSLGNDGYQKVGASVSSGLLEEGWAFTFMGSREWGEGYVPGTNYEAWSYFGNITKKIGRRHSLSLTAFGAPQWHNRRSNKHYIADYEASRDGIRMNDSYGYINGKVVGTYSGYNEYHKPQIALNHYWNIDGGSNLSTSVYMSNASGGGRKVYGPEANRLQYNYKTGRPYDETSLTPEGLIDYGPVMEDNRNSENGSKAIFTMGTNAHDWYGVLSVYTNRLSESFTLTAGIDGRYYIGHHYDKISDLLGGEYFTDNKLAWRDPQTRLKVGDKVNQDYLSRIMWLGGFAQAKYTAGRFNAFLSASANHHGYLREDPGKYGPFAADQTKYPASMKKGDWENFVPVSVKAGVSYAIAPWQNVFVNGAYMTKPPTMDNIYTDNTPIADPLMEKVVSAEVGYVLHAEKIRVSVGGYWTKWMDKSVTKAIGSWNGPRACIPDIDALHMGLEVEADYRPTDYLRLGGFLSLGNWRWKNDVNFTLVDEQDNTVGEFHAYSKDLHVGNTPQTSVMLSVAVKPLRNLELGADWNYYDRFYADFSPADRTNQADRADSWRVPSWSTLDLNMCYEFSLGGLRAQWIANVNNLFGTEYITDAVDGAGHDRSSALVWYGFGTTWSTGLRLAF